MDKFAIGISMEHTFVEQCHLQLSLLQEELTKREQKIEGNKRREQKYRRARLFKSNMFEEVEPHKKQYLERVLCYTLKSFGAQIQNKLDEHRRKNLRSINPMTPSPSPSPAPRGFSESRPCELVNAKDGVRSVRIEPCNFVYDDYGVIHLNPDAKKIKYSATGIVKQKFYLYLIVKIIKLIETDTYMTKRELYYKTLNFCKVNQGEKRPAPLTNGSPGEPSTSTQQQMNDGTSQGATQNQTQTQNMTQTFTLTQASTQQAGSQRASQKADAPIQQKYSTKKLDCALDDLCCLLGCSRLHLRILSQAKGMVYGNMKFTLKNGTSYDCLSKKEGIQLPTTHYPIVSIKSDAKFVLVVEKDAVFQQILMQESDCHFIENYKVILFTAKGYPDIASRAFLNFLWSKLKLPMLALTDADPHGLEILCTYKFGSFSTAYDSLYTTVPNMKWLGVLPSDLLQLGPLKELKHNLSDLRKIKSLSSRQCIKMRPNWMYQIDIMKDSGRKVELENLSDANAKYLVNDYLPNKLRFASWL